MKKVLATILLLLAAAFVVAAPALPNKEAKLLVVGDLFFDRYIRHVSEARGGDYLFSCIDPLLTSADLVIGNLEGPITSASSVSVGTKPEEPNNFRFTFSPPTAALLFAHNIKLVSLGNNHIMNFGRDGLLQTKQYLHEAGVQYFGDPDASEAERVARIELRGIPFSFVNWSDWSGDNTDHTVAQVRKEAEAGRTTIVYAHWGEEYVPPPQRVVQLAHAFVDAGAAAVFGSHPHIVQEHEIYKGKDIYYSLGNFIFDQYWNNDVSHGLAVLLTISKTGISTQEYPVELKRDGRVCPSVL